MISFDSIILTLFAHSFFSTVVGEMITVCACPEEPLFLSGYSARNWAISSSSWRLRANCSCSMSEVIGEKRESESRLGGGANRYQ